MAEDYAILKGIPLPERDSKGSGMTSSIRKMEYLDSIIVPESKLASIHACAKSAGARVRTQKNKDGTVTVWRIDPPSPILKMNIFGEDLKPKPSRDIFK